MGVAAILIEPVHFLKVMQALTDDCGCTEASLPLKRKNHIFTMKRQVCFTSRGMVSKDLFPLLFSNGIKSFIVIDMYLRQIYNVQQ